MDQDQQEFEDSDFNVHFHDFCADFNVHDVESVVALTDILEAIAKELAVSYDLRVTVGISEPPVWTDLRKLWSDLVEAQFASRAFDDILDQFASPRALHDILQRGLPGNSTTDSTKKRPPPRRRTLDEKEQSALRDLCGALAKFTRNLVAGVPDNQNGAFENEPYIRRLVHYHTSWSAMDDEESFPVTRALAQALSNMVTANEPLLSKLWDTYMNLPEPEVILIRLLGSPDARTILAVFVLILNCIHESPTRASTLSTSVIGARVCVSLLDDMVDLYDAEEATDGARAFDVGYDIFARLIESGLVPALYVTLTVADEIVTPHQTTLLKLVDSYLQSTQIAHTGIATPAKIARVHSQLGPLMLDQFMSLSTYAQHAIRKSLGITTASSLPDTGPSLSSRDKDAQSHSNGTTLPSVVPGAGISFPSQSAPALVELDAMLPKVCEALVLVAQCMITVTLESESAADVSSEDAMPDSGVKKLFIETQSFDQGLVESLVEVLCLLDIFLPRINFGKPVSSTPQNSGMPTASTAAAAATADPTGFSYLKRDLVRLLGILCHGSKPVQDRIRHAGGLQVVMNLCVVDERNPYLREHAIFTLRNLLDKNTENQAIVDGIKPQGSWNEDGVLEDVPGATRR